jgi:hypothetical protein
LARLAVGSIEDFTHQPITHHPPAPSWPQVSPSREAAVPNAPPGRLREDVVEVQHIDRQIDRQIDIYIYRII